MAEVLGAGFTTLTDLIHRIRTAVHDVGSTNRRWTDDEIYLSVYQAIGEAGGRFFYTDIYEDLDFVDGDVDYTLPNYMERVVTIERERTIPDIATTTGTTLDWEELKNWRQIKTPGNNRLLMLHDYPAGNVRITYEREVSFPIVDLKLSAAITSGATSISITIPGTYNIYEIEPPAYFQINNAEIIKVTAITAPATLTVSRAQLGTTAASAAINHVVSPVIIENDDRFATYVINAAAAYLNLLLIQDTNRGSDVAGNLAAMREFQSRAEKALARRKSLPKPRRMVSERSRRGKRL